MPYHVLVEPKQSPMKYAVELDLTELEVVDRVQKPFEAGRPILVGGKPFRIEEIEKIRVSYTDRPSAEVLREVRSMMEESRRSGNIIVNLGSAQSYLITDRRFSSNVTGRFLTKAPPLPSSTPSSRAPSTMETKQNDWLPWVWALMSAVAIWLVTRWLDVLSIGWATIVCLIAFAVLICVQLLWRRHRRAIAPDGSGQGNQGV